MSRSRSAIALVLVAAFAGLAGSPLAARELYWESLAVEARLDADGLLHVVERQTMVFSGDWNGGERTFRLGTGQRVELEGLRRVDPATGRETSLSEGDLDRVDHYDWTGPATLRWRSRLPSDPPFDETVITYVLDYTLSGVIETLDAASKTFAMAPDFVFPDRAGRIERFTLELEIDPVWYPLGTVPQRVERQDLAPGESAVVGAELRYTGDGWPADVPRPVPAWLSAALLLATLAAMAWMVAGLLRHEAAVGRYDPPPMPERLDRDWIERHLLSFPPEVAGALWDRAIGPPEVAAVIARLVSEGQLESEVEERLFGRKVLHLRRTVPFSELRGYDRVLVAGLFVEGAERTDTETLRQHYRSSGKGYRPAAEIQPGLELAVESALREAAAGEAPPPPDEPGILGRRRSLWLLLAAVAAFGLALALRPEVHMVLGVFLLVGASLLYGFGRALAAAWGRRIDWGNARALLFLVPGFGIALLGAAGVLFVDRFSPVPSHLAAQLGIALLALAAISSLVRVARSRETRAGVRLRQRLAAARRMLRDELERTDPDLEDAWLPYLLALGLEREVDRWSVSYAGSGASEAMMATRGTSSSSSSSGGGWSGGGGAFGGAGATSGWAAAAGGLAAGVSAPSSSGSGGGGGGGGGGSSGGGGGGGW